ncbi:MAG TPA: hypothetical protein VK875_04875 [Euzebyales bacterium]|nr:hypothetical protein [Euzebyales bacterium]
MQFGLFRFAFLAVSKVLSKLFGVATLTFFGRVPSRDDEQVAAVGLLCLWWIFLPPAIAVPEYAELVIPFLPDDDGVVRAVAVALTVALPLVVGWLVSTVHNRRDRGRRVRQVLSGYLYAPVIGLLVIALVIVVPISRAAYLFRRFELRHFAVMVRSGSFEGMVAEVQDALERVGITTAQAQPPRPLRWVFRGLTEVEEHIFRRDLTPQMRLLRGEVDGQLLEITVHATDLSIVGPQKVVSYVKAVLSEELSPEHLYYTWDDDAQALEDEILRLRHRLDDDGRVEYEQVLRLRDRLRELELDAEEWNAVRRQLYALERDCFRLRDAA